MPIHPPRPPALGADGRIVEGIVTTENLDGAVNISPMGPIVGDGFQYLWLRPFRTSTTFQNLKRTGAGVFHVTDDVELFAQAAVGQPHPTPPTITVAGARGAILAGACRWYAFEVASIEDSSDRTVIVAHVVASGNLRDFLGFNRAKHAVIEAAILATRIHLLDREFLLAEFERLASPVTKTGAAAEVTAFNFLRDYVTRELSRGEPSA